MVECARVADVSAALGIEGSGGLIAIVGGGGKSSLMFALAKILPGRVVMTTTTRIFASQMNLAPAVCRLDEEDFEDRLESSDSSLLVVGEVEGDRAVGVSQQLPARWLEHASVDWVVVEADGSRMLPVKAPAAHEPVVPRETDLLVAVAGIDALAGPIRDVAHRPELVSALSGLDADECLTPEALAEVLSSPQGGLKNLPDSARAALLLNKVETPDQLEDARRVARAALVHERVERVAIGALMGRGLSSSRGPSDSRGPSSWEVWLR